MYNVFFSVSFFTKNNRPNPGELLRAIRAFVYQVFQTPVLAMPINRLQVLLLRVLWLSPSPATTNPVDDEKETGMEKG